MSLNLQRPTSFSPPSYSLQFALLYLFLPCVVWRGRLNWMMSSYLLWQYLFTLSYYCHSSDNSIISFNLDFIDIESYEVIPKHKNHVILLGAEHRTSMTSIACTTPLLFFATPRICSVLSSSSSTLLKPQYLNKWIEIIHSISDSELGQ